MLRPRSAGALVLAAALLLSTLAGCTDDGGGDDDRADTSTSTRAPGDAPGTAEPDTTTTTVAAAGAIVFNAQGNDLDAYETIGAFERQTVVASQARDPDGLDVNGQICFDPRNPNRFVAGEDTGQPNPPAGWAVFELEGLEVGDLRATKVDKLTPTYQPGGDDPENYGCGFLPDGRVVTTDVGNQATGPGDGQLILWFPPFGGDDPGTATRPADAPRYCKLDVAIATAQQIHVDAQYVYVASARPPTAGVWRYRISSFPRSPDPAGGCTATDATGAPLAPAVAKELLIAPGAPNRLVSPSGIARARNGNLYVSSVINGVIDELTLAGQYVRTVLQPPAGEALGAQPFSTGTPLGLGVDTAGNLYYADIGIVRGDGGFGPGRGAGTVRVIRFADDRPQEPVVMGRGLAFPDGIGVWEPPGRAGFGSPIP